MLNVIINWGKKKNKKKTTLDWLTTSGFQLLVYKFWFKTSGLKPVVHRLVVLTRSQYLRELKLSFYCYSKIFMWR